MKDQTRLIPMSYTNMIKASDYAISHKNVNKEGSIQNSMNFKMQY